ncbi:putative protein kinase CAMK-AMPK family [Medicago truncatula]|uniref:Protein kinase domain-containing protein n=1 Tax=Medicago truncatula TaxID=3880 RepID=A0A396GZS4_MEDTR|nr:putative protein kinase CAMK-AMPK family [Medicago truncatula]
MKQKVFSAGRKFLQLSTNLYFGQIISAVEFGHSKRIVHLDLKPENILFDAHNSLKLVDFGLCEIMRNGYFLQKIPGSP